MSYDRRDFELWQPLPTVSFLRCPRCQILTRDRMSTFKLKNKIFSPRRTSCLFLPLDIIAFGMQIAGLIIISPDRPEQIRTGQTIVIVGLSASFACFTIFEMLNIYTHVKAVRNLKTGERMPKWHRLFIPLHISMVMFIIRSIYRLVEFTPGAHNKAILSETAFYLLDVVPIFVVYCAQQVLEHLWGRPQSNQNYCAWLQRCSP